jgi:hypothetical protein
MPRTVHGAWSGQVGAGESKGAHGTQSRDRRIRIAAKRAVKFRVAKAAKDAILI